MNKKLLLIVLIVLIVLSATPVFAERWIQCNEITIGSVTYEKPIRREGDCTILGLCTGPNNQGLDANVFEAKGGEWNAANNANAKCDQLVPEGSRITTLTAQEIADIQAAQDASTDSSIREGAKSGFDGVNVTGLQYKALVMVLISEINILRQAIEDVTLESNQLTDKNLPDRTLLQAKTAIKNAIDAGTVDSD